MALRIINSSKTAILFGSDTKVGSRCLAMLLASDAYESILTFDAELPPISHLKLTKYKIDFENIEASKALIKGNDLYCCLGTSFNTPNSGKELIQVDSKYSYEIAQIAAENQINQFVFLSSAGANTEGLFFYNKFKGKLEQIIKSLDFWSVHIFKPSFILEESPSNNIGESLVLRLGGLIDKFTNGFVSKYKPIEAELVAQAMINMAQLPSKNGVFVYENPDIEGIIQKNRLT